MQVLETDIADIKLLKPVRHVDSRGFFSEVFKDSELRERGIDIHFVQDNHSLSASKGVVRGLHFQIPPFAQAKLLRVTTGSIFDVAVDLRWGSPSFGRHVSAVLSAVDWNQIFIPEGFAHGYCTLEPNTEVIYKVSAYYSPEHDRGLLWNDPALGIAWPISADQRLMSEKDRTHPVLSRLPRHFGYGPPITAPPPADAFPSVTQTTVEGVALHRLKRVEDIRGNLLVGEFERELPFVPARFFTIFDVPGTRVRGEHAHRRCKQFVICLRGTCSILVEDGRNREEIPLGTPDFGAYIPPMIWMTLYKFSSNALLLVFASSYYDPDDYIRDYEVYLRSLDNNALQDGG